jgi:hypothetical protein
MRIYEDRFLVNNVLDDTCESLEDSGLWLLEAPNELKHILSLLNDKGLIRAIALPQSVRNVLVFNHEVLEARHLLILALEVALE